MPRMQCPILVIAGYRMIIKGQVMSSSENRIRPAQNGSYPLIYANLREYDCIRED
jgi:hypothetical protein